MWKCGNLENVRQIPKLPDFQISKSPWQVGNPQYITNLQGLQIRATAGLDTILLTFYTSTVIKLTTCPERVLPTGDESREGEDIGHEQDYWH
jgi:hypothetical protein